jgi:hypothetical protein
MTPMQERILSMLPATTAEIVAALRAQGEGPRIAGSVQHSLQLLYGRDLIDVEDESVEFLKWKWVRKVTLPPPLRVKSLLDLPVPGDVTLDVVRTHIEKTIGPALSPHLKPGRSVSVRFIIAGEEAPDTLTLNQFRASGGTISIDDGSGGMRVKEGV